MQRKANADGRPVLFVVNSLGIGGSERKIVRVVNELHKIGWNVHLCYLNNPDDLLQSVNPDIPLVFLDRRGKLSIGAIIRLMTYIQETRISKIICISLFPLLYAILARLFSRHRDTKIAVMVNATKLPNRKTSAQMFIYRPLLSRVNEVVFGCDFQRVEWENRYRLDRSRCAVIYNGVDEEWFSPNTELCAATESEPGFKKSTTCFLVGTVGNLRPEKNHVELIRAFAELQKVVTNAQLVIVGQGAEQQKLEKLIEENELSDRVFMLGQIDDVRPVVKMIDVFVIPSLSETFSNAALEAMSMGKSIILSDSGGAKEMVNDGKSGFIYRTGDLPTLVELLHRLARDPKLRSELGKNARARVISLFSFTKMIKEYEALLHGGLLEKNKLSHN
jgi:glycosyltransferase involved in cell wall biosynthesis